jgi:hypothetical protein
MAGAEAARRSNQLTYATPPAVHTQGMNRRALAALLIVTVRAAGHVAPPSVESCTTTLSFVADVFCAYDTKM